RAAIAQPQQQWARRRRYYEFLASRCSGEFLARYISVTPKFWDDVLGFSSFLSVTPQFSLLMTLQDEGLLPAERKNTVVDLVKVLAVETPDADFLHVDRIRAFFSPEELHAIMDCVVENLLPYVDDTVESWRENFDKSEGPEAYFGPLIEAFDAFREYLSDDVSAHKTLTSAIDDVETLISEYEPEPDSDEVEDDDYFLGPPIRSTPTKRAHTTYPPRPIYDDLDA
ncbi:MAG TPA: hypothetical protein VF713_08870, partial [Thermoanaerobaculia bacterium]